MSESMLIFCKVFVILFLIAIFFMILVRSTAEIFRNKKEKDGIICVFETPKGYSLKFILCVPFEDFMNKKSCNMEIKKINDEELYRELAEDSQEKPSL